MEHSLHPCNFYGGGAFFIPETGFGSKLKGEIFMVTQAFATKTMFLSRKNAAVNGYWGVALDIGYSSVKGFSQNAVFSFPSFARKSTGRFVAIGDPAPQDILYRDEQGVWNVGASALAALSSDDRNDSLDTLFGRNRYFKIEYFIREKRRLLLIYGSLLFRVKMNDVMSIQFQLFHEPFQNQQCVFSSKLPVHDWQNGHYIQQQNEIFSIVPARFLM